MNDLSHIRSISPQEFAAVLDQAKARAAVLRNEAFDAAWAALVAGARRLALRARETTTAKGPSAIGTPRHADFR